MLSGLPVAFWIGASMWDVVAFFLPNPRWGELAFSMLALGLVSALPVMATGLVEFGRVEPDHPAEAVAWRHMISMMLATGIFLTSLWLRRGHLEAPTPPITACVVSGLGVVVTTIGGWLGGELVFRYGVGVEQEERS